MGLPASQRHHGYQLILIVRRIGTGVAAGFFRGTGAERLLSVGLPLVLALPQDRRLPGGHDGRATKTALRQRLVLLNF
jgi:hypothetical protein